jgi:hypothetical protein
MDLAGRQWEILGVLTKGSGMEGRRGTRSVRRGRRGGNSRAILERVAELGLEEHLS